MKVMESELQTGINNKVQLNPNSV